MKDMFDPFEDKFRERFSDFESEPEDDMLVKIQGKLLLKAKSKALALKIRIWVSTGILLTSGLIWWATTNNIISDKNLVQKTNLINEQTDITSEKKSNFIPEKNLSDYNTSNKQNIDFITQNKAQDINLKEFKTGYLTQNKEKEYSINKSDKSNSDNIELTAKQFLCLRRQNKYFVCGINYFVYVDKRIDCAKNC